MARHKSAVLTPGLSGPRAQRTSSKKIRYLHVIDDNCTLNADGIIRQAKQSAAFGSISWDEVTWNVTQSENQRGHKQRDAYLHFTQHRNEQQKGRKLGEPFDNQNGFSDLVKAIIRLRREIGGQNANNQGEIIIAFRYLHDELEGVDFDLKMLTPAHLDAASRRVVERESEVSAYKRIEKLEEIARILNDNGLVRASLTWQSAHKKRPASMNGIRLDDPDNEANQKKLPVDGLIEAVANLYHVIPKDAWADRVRICLISLLVITGFRIGELLTLPARRVATDPDTGRKYIAYYPEKRMPPGKKWLMTEGGEIAESIVDEILELTREPREVAQWMHQNPGKILFDEIDWSREFLPVAEVGRALGLSLGYVNFFKAREIDMATEEGRLVVRASDLERVLRSESYDKPVNVVTNTGEKLLLKDALACAFLNAFHSNRITLRYAVLPISEQQISDFLRSRAGMPSAFEKYGISGPDGAKLEVASHGFRHWLNDLLDRGGLTDVEQAVYFGRRNPKDNRAYQHMTPAERTRRARQDLKDGYMLGPVAEVVARLPIEKQEAVLQARVQAVHVVPGGVCFHQFSQSPCPNHMACTDGCGDFHWQTNDDIEVRELEYQKKVLVEAIEVAKREVAEESWGADSWLDHNVRKLNQVQQCLTDCCSRKKAA